MGEGEEVLRFLLPDLLGKPKAMIDEKGNLIALEDFEFPSDNYVFFIPVKEWEEFKSIGGKG